MVSPKNSGVKRARSLAEHLDAQLRLLTMHKTVLIVTEGYIIGDVAGKSYSH